MWASSAASSLGGGTETAHDAGEVRLGVPLLADNGMLTLGARYIVNGRHEFSDEPWTVDEYASTSGHRFHATLEPIAFPMRRTLAQRGMSTFRVAPVVGVARYVQDHTIHVYNYFTGETETELGHRVTTYGTGVTLGWAPVRGILGTTSLSVRRWTQQMGWEVALDMGVGPVRFAFAWEPRLALVVDVRDQGSITVYRDKPSGAVVKDKAFAASLGLGIPF